MFEFKKSLQRIMRHKVLQFWSKLGPNCRVFPTGAGNKEEYSTCQIFAHSLSYYQEKSPLCRLPHQSFSPSTKYQFPCFNPVKTFLAFQPLSLLLDHFYFNFIHFFHSSHINFNFNQCLMFKECCF